MHVVIEKKADDGERSDLNTYTRSHSQGIFDNLRDQLAIAHHTRRNLDHLLVPPLDTAFPLPQVRYSSRTVADNLDFDVAEAVDCRFLGEELLRGRLFYRTSDSCV
jgi:hypothetical protein